MEYKLTMELFIKTLETIYNQRFYHEDFQKLNQEKLKLLNELLFKEELISFENIKNKSYFVFKTNRTDVEIDYANYVLNDLFEKLAREYALCRGELTTTSNIVDLHKKVEIFKCNLIVASHAEQINKEYRKVIHNLLNYLYSNICFGRLNIKEVQEGIIPKTVFDINYELSKKDIQLLNKSLNEYDYI